MSLLHNAYSGGSASATIANSLRFRRSAGANLNLIWGAAPTNQAVFSIFGWVKRGMLGVEQALAGDASDSLSFAFFSDDTIGVRTFAGTIVKSTAVFRDVAAFYHVMMTHSGTTVNVYVNRTLVLTYAGSLILAGAGFNSAGVQMYIGNSGVASSNLDGVLAHFGFVDGLVIASSAVAAVDATTGEFKPLLPAQIRSNIVAAGGWGTNGFFLMFNGTPGATIYDRKVSDTDTTGNNFTATGISSTPGATYDWWVDSPSNDLVAGTQPVGNYCCINPLYVPNASAANAVTDGNLNVAKASSANSSPTHVATMALPSSGTYYWEVTKPSGGIQAGYGGVGVTDATNGCSSDIPGISSYAIYEIDGRKYVNGVRSAYGSAITDGATVGFLYDAGAQTLTCFLGAVSQGVIASGLAAGRFPCGTIYASGTVNWQWNFGQRPFVNKAANAPAAYTLCSTNFPTASVKKGSSHVQVKLDTGANIKTTCEATFTNILEWIKDRANVNNHQLLDSVRGLAGNALQSNTTSPGAAYAAPTGNSVGFCWNLSQAAAANNVGSIASSVAVNATAGIAVGTYTGTGANATVGHGLGFAPTAADGYMLLVKDTTAASANNWMVAHSGLTSAAYYILLNTAAAQVNDATAWNSTAPTSTVFSIGTHAAVNTAGHTYEFILFFGVPGFSRFGKHVGNANANGSFAYNGFAACLSLLKSSTAATDWHLYDTARNTTNVAAVQSVPNTTAAEASISGIDILSNGYKLRTVTTDPNAAQTYISASFAASPLNYSNAR